MHLKNYSMILFALLFVVTGCNQPLSENGEIAKAFLEEMGYEIISHEGDLTHTFSRAELLCLASKKYIKLQRIYT